MNTELILNIAELCAGVGLFIFAMFLVEESLKQLSGRNFKLFLQHITKNRVGAAAGGAIVTALLQSSSVVSLMVLALVGAGVFTTQSALAIVFGANLGTTLGNWIIATLGFKIDIDVIAFPAVFAGGLIFAFFRESKKMKTFATFIVGFGLVFIALSFMKTAMQEQVTAFDISAYRTVHPGVYLLVGFVLTLIVQSSSVAIAFTLSALSAGAVDFVSAAAIALGAETGTVVKLVFSAIGGTATKKRVVTGNIVFNLVLTVVVFSFLHSIVHFITDVIGIKDPLIGLVAFSTLNNFATIILFLLILDPLTSLLKKLFTDTTLTATVFLKDAEHADAATALSLFQKETHLFIYTSIRFNLELFEITTGNETSNTEFDEINKQRNYESKKAEEKYEFLKQHQGEIQSFFLDLRSKSDSERNARLNQLISAVRSSMHAAKSVNDISSNIANLKKSTENIQYDFFMHHRDTTRNFYTQLLQLTASGKPDLAALRKLLEKVQERYTAALDDFYREAQNSGVNGTDITTIINFNRELFTSNKAILMAVKDFLLDEDEAADFNTMLVYKT